MEIREEFLWGYAEKLEEDAATALAYAMEELENSKNPEIHVYVADALMALDDYEGAVEEINEALEKNIVNVNYAKSLKGEALFYLERYEESKKVFTEILDSNPNSFFVVAYLTDIDIKLGKYAEGIARAEKVLSSNTLSNSDAAHIKANVGWIKLKYLHKASEAMVDFEEALKLDANMGSVYIGIAEYYMSNKDYEKALEISLDKIFYRRVVPYGKAMTNTFVLPNKKEYYKNILELSELDNSKIKVLIDDPILSVLKNKTDENYLACSAGINNLGISSNGVVYPCIFLREKIGDLNVDSLQDIWINNEILKKLRNRDIGKCGKCQYSRICGGCRAFSGIYKKDSFCPLQRR